MEHISESLLNEVLFCHKCAIRADRKRMAFDNRHRKNTVYLISEDKKYEYKLYMRQSEEFLEDFSVGLIWTNPTQHIDITKNSVMLLRCQGPHDGKAPLGTDIHHDYHIHRISLNDFQERRYQKPSDRILTSNFASFEQALFYLISNYKVDNIETVIDLPEEVTQTSLYEGA